MKKKLFLPILVLIAGLFLAQALICNFASAERVDLAMTREEIKELEKNNRALEAEITAFSSLTKVSSAAGQLGFSSAKVVYTSFDLPVAMGIKN